MSLELFLEKLRNTPEEITFKETMEIIEERYTFVPTAFKNGKFKNEEGVNSGSCKLFSFAKRQQLTKEETLACFGNYYFVDVLKHPNGTDHQNIRNFMKTGWKGIHFEREALVLKIKNM